MGIINTVEIIYVAFMWFLTPIHCWSTAELIKIYKHLGRCWKCTCHSVLQDPHRTGQIWPETGHVYVPWMAKKGLRSEGDTVRTQKYSGVYESDLLSNSQRPRKAFRKVKLCIFPPCSWLSTDPCLSEKLSSSPKLPVPDVTSFCCLGFCLFPWPCCKGKEEVWSVCFI